MRVPKGRAFLERGVEEIFVQVVGLVVGDATGGAEFVGGALGQWRTKRRGEQDLSIKSWVFKFSTCFPRAVCIWLYLMWI